MPVSENTAESPRSAPPRFARSAQMVSCLRQELLYSEKRARDILFASIERVMADQDQDPPIVARVTREAAARAREEAERTGYECTHWDNAAKAVMKALLCSGSLLDPEGQPIPFGVSAHASPVGSLRDGYRDRAETFLLEYLLRRMGDVSVRDHTALAHALFRQFDQTIPLHDLEDRVVILLAQLADRVALDGDTYTVRAV